VTADFRTWRSPRAAGHDRRERRARQEASRRAEVSVGYRAGFIGEGEISYAGENCVKRARLAGEIVAERLPASSGIARRYRGLSALHTRPLSDGDYQPYEVRLRVRPLGRPRDGSAHRRGVEALWTNGPAGGGGARKSTQEQIGIVSCLIARDKVKRSHGVRELTLHPSPEGRIKRDMKRRLYDLAHARAGDKGNTTILSLIAYRTEDFPLLRDRVTPDAVKRHFAGIIRGKVTRHELPGLGALQFIGEDALAAAYDVAGIDAHGKSLSAGAAGDGDRGDDFDGDPRFGSGMRPADVFIAAVRHHQAASSPRRIAFIARCSPPSRAICMRFTCAVRSARGGRNADAVKLIGRAIALDPQVPDFHYNIGLRSGRSAPEGSVGSLGTRNRPQSELRRSAAEPRQCAARGSPSRACAS